MIHPLPWHDEGDRLGVHVLIHFFDPIAVAAQPDGVGRQLPVLAKCESVTAQPPRLVRVDAAAGFRVGRLVARPDAVYSHGAGLLCLLQEPDRPGAPRVASAGGDDRALDPSRWREQLPVVRMLQCIASAMAVSGERQLLTAALWRGVNAVCQFDPGPMVLERLAREINAARRYWNEPRQVTAAQLASFCEPVLRAEMTRPAGDAA